MARSHFSRSGANSPRAGGRAATSRELPPSPELGAAIWWVRRDLRLHDNPALVSALRHPQVIPVFVLDPLLELRSLRRMRFLLESLRALDRSLRERGSSLVVRRGDPAEVLAQLVRETAAERVYAHAEVSPFGRRREAEVAGRVPLSLVGWPTLFPPTDLVASAGAYRVYSRFRQRVLSLPAPTELKETPGALPPHGLVSEPLPAQMTSWPAGEAEALRRMRAFARGPLLRYHRERDRLDLGATSGLSPYLRFGSLSCRLAYRMALEADSGQDPEAGRGARRWCDELLWREFFAHLMYHAPHTRRLPLRPHQGPAAWDNDEELFRAWCEGRTGYPVVDAAMRELRETGWIHNRARMIVASFLVKNLLVDWRWGERYFMEHLLDGDPASNVGNWQWIAGVGADAAPYFRILNPVLQGQRFDPQGCYVRRWVPEVAKVPSPYVHAPWTLPRDDQVAYGCRVGKDYPAPVVDLKESRHRALERYARARPRLIKPSRL